MADQAPKKWYLQKANGERWGPGEITSWHVEWGYLRPGTLVWTEGQPDWLSAEQTELRSLFTDVKLPPPLPHEREGQQGAISPERQVAPTARLADEMGQLPNDERRWYIITPAGHQQGPMKASHLHWSIKYGNLRRDTLVRVIGQEEWVAADRTELKPLLDEFLPTGPDAISDAPSVRSEQVHAGLQRPSGSGSDTSGKSRSAFGTVALIGLILAIGVPVVMFQTSSGNSRNQQAIEACRWKWTVSVGAVADRDYDWKRGYVRDAYVDLNIPASSKAGGQPIKCIMIPKTGVQESGDACGVFSAQPENHLVCRMIYDPRQEGWVHTHDVK